MRLASTVSNLSAGTAGLNAHIVAKNKPPANRMEVASAAHWDVRPQTASLVRWDSPGDAPLTQPALPWIGVFCRNLQARQIVASLPFEAVPVRLDRIVTEEEALA